MRGRSNDRRAAWRTSSGHHANTPAHATRKALSSVAAVGAVWPRWSSRRTALFHFHSNERKHAFRCVIGILLGDLTEAGDGLNFRPAQVGVEGDSSNGFVRLEALQDLFDGHSSLVLGVREKKAPAEMRRCCE